MRNEDFGKYTLMAPRCPSCAGIMSLARASRFGDDLYIHYVFECRACGVAHVDAVEIEAA
jgi:rRNA maturation protein Nop10